MKTELVWKQGMEFEAQAGAHKVTMDAKTPIGKDQGTTPKELVAMGLGGCTAMDVIALLKKYKQPPTSFQVDVEVEPSTGAAPIVFAKANIRFVVEGAVEPEKLIEAVTLSQTKYCGVSAMLAKAFPIEYHIILNNEEIKTGFANFENQ